MVTAFRVGGGADSVVGNLKVGLATVATTNYMTFEYPVGTDLFAAPGKTLYITKILFNTPVANAEFSLGYADDGVPNQAGAPTTPIIVTMPIIFIATVKLQYERDVFIPIPATKYPFIKSGVNLINIMLFGIEL